MYGPVLLELALFGSLSLIFFVWTDAVQADHAASHIGKALGLVTLLRSVPHNALRQRVQVPVELLVRHRVSQQELLRGSAEKHVKDLVFDVAGSANAHLEKVTSSSCSAFSCDSFLMRTV